MLRKRSNGTLLHPLHSSFSRPANLAYFRQLLLPMKSLTISPDTPNLQLFSAMPGNSILLRPDAPAFTVVAATEGYLKMTGRHLSELVDKAFLQSFPNNPADPAKRSEKAARASLEHVLRHKEPQALTIRYDIAGTSGRFEERHWQITNKPVLAKDGSVLYLLHSVEEITAWVSANRREEALLGLEKGYRELMNAPILVCILKGGDYRIAMANDRTLRFWNKSADVIGKPFLQVLPELQEQGFIEIMDKVRQTGKPEYTYEQPAMLLQHGKPETFYLDFIFQPYFENETDPQPSGVLCVAHNQTEQVKTRKKAEESERRFRNLISEADVATAVYFGRQMRIQYANEAMIRLWGKDTSVIGKTIREALPELEGQPFHAQLNHVFTTGETYWGKEDKGELMVDGKLKTFYFNFTYKALRSADGAIYGILNMATDVTEQVMAKKKLEESESNLRNTILQAPVAMCILKGPEYVVSVANDRIYELWGKTKAEMLGKPVFVGLPEARNQGLEEILHNVYVKGERFAADERPVILPRNGLLETAYINFVYEPFREGDGTVSGIIAVASEVTEQVKARQKVEQSEQRFQNLVRETTVGIAVLVGEEAKVAVVNDAYARLLGRKADDLVQQNLFGVIPEAAEWFRPVIDQVRTSGQPVYLYDQPYTVFADRKKIEGFLNVVYQPYREIDGTTTGVMVVCQDVTPQVLARRKIAEAQETASLAVDSAELGTFDVDLLTNHITASERLETIFDVTGQADRDRYINAIHPNDLDVRTQAYKAAFENGLLAYEARVVRQNGAVRWIRVKGRVFFENEKPVKLVGVVQDITDEKAFATELSRKVKERTQELEQFLFVSHHDLQEPLRKILLFSDMIKAEVYPKLSASSQQRFDKITAAARRMGAALRDVLDFASLNKSQPDLNPVNLNEVLEAVQSDLELMMAEKGATLEADALPVIAALPQQMHQLFYNLLSNALKFSIPGQAPVITVQQHPMTPDELSRHTDLEQGRRHVHFTVADNGIGFRQEMAEKIFTLFQRLHSKDQYAGTGIGLALCRKVVQNHRGKIWAEGREGEGAAFHFILPV